MTECMAICLRAQNLIYHLHCVYRSLDASHKGHTINLNWESHKQVMGLIIYLECENTILILLFRCGLILTSLHTSFLFSHSHWTNKKFYTT